MEAVDDPTMISVLVTGGTGFFGHSLVRLLLEDERIGTINVLARNAAPTEYALSRYIEGPTENGLTRLTPKDQPNIGFAGVLKDFERLEPIPGRLPIPGRHGEAVMQSSSNAVFDDERVRLYVGDVAKRNVVRAAMDGCTWVFHACGDTSFWWQQNERQRMTNVNGTHVVCQTATDSPTVTRLVHTSTVDIMGCGVGLDEIGEPLELDERHAWDQYSYKGYGYNYADTKREGEEIALSYNHPHVEHCITAKARGYMGHGEVGNLEVVVIRPGSMIGPWDVTNQYGRVFKDLKAGSMPMVPCGGSSWCHVDGVARAHLEAASSQKEGIVGGVFNCEGENVSYHSVFERMASCLEPPGTIHAPSFRAPWLLLWVYGVGCEIWSMVWSGEKPDINPGMAIYMSCHAHYCSDKAKDVLGYDPGSLDDAILDSYNWYCRRGKL